MFYFEIREGRMASRTPVDYVVAPVNKAFFIEPDKYFLHRPRQSFVKGEPLPAPVAGSAHALELVDDGAAIEFFPLPDLFYELFPSKGMPVYSFALEVLFNDVLGRNACMVSPRHPQGVTPAHPLPSDQDVLEGDG